MTEIDIRAATTADIPALHRLVESAYRGEASRAGWTTEADLLDGQRTDPEELADILADPKQALLTAWLGDGLVGCVLIADRGDSTGYLGMLSVSPTLQGSGLGRRLVAAAHRGLAERFGARQVRISVFPYREALVGWYQRLGYAPTGETLPFPYDDPRSGIPLRDDLHFIVLSRPLP
ncbi:GNAT family N-acetyltransferase [Brevundimonas sp. UBA7664]|uniref:GNAT family N-acetyltransferase n=1 Tax=Brevundimonas sp. UBA7664 TaxID=1946141 RepID=UPI0025BD9258|nr:GNAT family N-acetyltransferase [Brevundimonas sp. UBA7664]